MRCRCPSRNQAPNPSPPPSTCAGEQPVRVGRGDVKRYLSGVLSQTDGIKVPCYRNRDTHDQFYGWEHDWELDVLQKRNGTTQVRLQCARCYVGRTLSYAELEAHGVDPYSLEPTRSHLGENGDCIVVDCYAIDVEFHHFAPKSVFGMEANDWPVMPVCRDHHTIWHLAMNGYQWNASQKEIR